jgi:lipopolysaccharide transport system permease protein
MYQQIQPTQRWRRRQLIYYFDLVRELVSRELKLLYKRSVLGIAWTLINPLLQLLVFSIVFTMVLKAGQGIEHYASYAFSGLLIWGWTQSSLFQATGLITGNRALIRQPSFPKAILPVITVTTGFVHFLLALPALFVIMLIEKVEFSWNLLLLPLLFVLQFILTISFAYPLAALNVTFRDTQHTLGVILQLMFYLLPVFYAVNDQTIPPELRPVYAFNPIVILIQAYRFALLQQAPPDWLNLLILVGACLALLPIGYSIFQRQGERFVEEV